MEDGVVRHAIGRIHPCALHKADNPARSKGTQSLIDALKLVTQNRLRPISPLAEGIDEGDVRARRATAKKEKSMRMASHNGPNNVVVNVHHGP